MHVVMSQNVRKHAVNEDDNTPPSKRTEVETHEFSLPNDSSDTTTSDQKVKASDTTTSEQGIATVKRVIKIRRKPSSHQSVPANTSFEKVR